MTNINNKSIILFDGACNLCNNSIQFIIKRNKKQNLFYTSLQSDASQDILLQFQIEKVNFDSIILVENGKIHQKSTAILKISRHLKGGWKLCYGFIIIPKCIRDYLYTIIASNRYKWFGKRESCMIPTEELKSRFLDL